MKRLKDSIKDSIYESIVDIDDNIVSTRNYIEKIEQTRQVVKKFEDDLLQFITKEFCYAPGKKGLPTKTMSYIPNLGTCVFKSSTDIHTNKDMGKHLGKYNNVWTLAIKAEDIYKNTDINPEEFFQYTIDFKKQFLNHIKQFIKKYDKDNIFKILQQHHEFSVNLNTLIDHYGKNTFFEFYVMLQPREVKHNYFQSFMITLRNNKAL
jgi:hypothetical protein